MPTEKIIHDEAPEIPVRAACLVSGCTCKDPRIVSYRRAAFVAFRARQAGQTADRVIAAEAAWRLPSPPLIDPASTILDDRIARRDRSGIVQAPAAGRMGLER